MSSCHIFLSCNFECTSCRSDMLGFLHRSSSPTPPTHNGLLPYSLTLSIAPPESFLRTCPRSIAAAHNLQSFLFNNESYVNESLYEKAAAIEPHSDQGRHFQLTYTRWTSSHSNPLKLYDLDCLQTILEQLRHEEAWFSLLTCCPGHARHHYIQ